MSHSAESLPWQALKVLCQGVSIIDIPRLELKNEAEAYQFLLTYGYDAFESAHQDYLWRVYDEACDLLQKKICPNPKTFPEILRDREAIGDVRNLLLIASGVQSNAKISAEKFQPWVCAVLRISHTIFHLDSDLRLKYLAKIRQQTLDRFEAHIQRLSEEGAEKMYLGFERDKVRLAGFEKKEGKYRESVLLKLLHKVENVAQQVYDYIGIRLITPSRSEAMLALKYLIDHHLVAVPNIMPSRCKNTLIDLEEFEKNLAHALRKSEAVDYEELDSELSFPKIVGDDNPFSSNDFRAIQFTCRPLIRIPMQRRGVSRGEVSFFFPMEVQLMDEKSYQRSLQGEADHAKYKEKQLEAVRARVLRGIDIAR